MLFGLSSQSWQILCELLLSARSQQAWRLSAKVQADRGARGSGAELPPRKWCAGIGLSAGQIDDARATTDKYRASRSSSQVLSYVSGKLTGPPSGVWGSVSCREDVCQVPLANHWCDSGLVFNAHARSTCTTSSRTAAYASHRKTDSPLHVAGKFDKLHGSGTRSHQLGAEVAKGASAP